MHRAPTAVNVESATPTAVPAQNIGGKNQASINLLIETLSALGYDVTTERPDQQLAYSEQDAARLLSISPRTLFTLRKEGKVRAVRVGNRVIYAREELKRFLAGSAQ